MRPNERRTVLLIDDDPDIVVVLRLMLGRLGHEVYVAADGRSALRVAAQMRPAVIICDLGLHDMDGCEVARRLRAEGATAGSLLIAYTGRGGDAIRRRVREAGFDHYVLKPGMSGELLKLLE